MWEYLRAVFGELSFDELLLVGIIFFSVVAYSWAPKVGETVAGLFDPDEE